MLEIGRMVFVTEIEDRTAILDKPAGTKKYRTGVHRQDMFKAASVYQRKIQFYELLQIPARLLLCEPKV